MSVQTVLAAPVPEAPEDIGDTSYGKAFVALERPVLENRNSIALSYGLGLANPLYNSYELELKYTYSLTESLSLGAGADLFLTEDSDFSKRLAASLMEEGYRADTYLPQTALKIIAEYTPFKGLLNIRSSSVVDLDLTLSLALGTTFFKEPQAQSFLVDLGLAPTVSIGNRWAFFLGIFYAADFLGVNTVPRRVDLRTGTLWHF